MIQITRDNVHKILDIDVSQISEELHNIIGDVEPTYKDNVEDMQEHLYSWDEVLQMSERDMTGDTYDELMQLAELCNENEIAYIRIITM